MARRSFVLNELRDVLFGSVRRLEPHYAPSVAGPESGARWHFEFADFLEIIRRVHVRRWAGEFKRLLV